MFDEAKKFYDRVFGNRDGKFDIHDLPNHAVLVVVVVADLVMLIAEWRVWSVGKMLTGSDMLALGFVAVSSVPFYLGQLAFRYNRANDWQQWLAVGMVFMGLGVSAYYGFADYLIASNTSVAIAQGLTVAIDINSLYVVAIVCTVALIIGGLLYGLLDDEFANTLKQSRIEARANTARQEIEIKRKLLEDLRRLRMEEDELKAQYPQDFDALQTQFYKSKKPANTPANAPRVFAADVEQPLDPTRGGK
jgi:hypothetical protein